LKTLPVVFVKHKRHEVVMEAVPWSGINRESIDQFTSNSKSISYGTDAKFGRPILIIENFNEAYVGMPGDWLIRDHRGNYLTVSNKAFNRYYEIAKVPGENERRRFKKGSKSGP